MESEEVLRARKREAVVLMGYDLSKEGMRTPPSNSVHYACRVYYHVIILRQESGPCMQVHGVVLHTGQGWLIKGLTFSS